MGGRYELLGQLGSGGMGAVFRARDEVRDRIVALKQLELPTGHRNANLLKALFEREFFTLSRLKHPCIIEVYDYGVSEAGPYYTMELLEGGDLHALAPLPYRDACRLLRDVASSLALIHAHRLVHRDVSPRNVRLTAHGRAKLIDFGALASFGASREIIGTPSCVAPETLDRLTLDQRTDLFALGAVAYWVLTRRGAYPARSLRELPSVWDSTPAPPSQFRADIPPELDALVLSMLKLDPLERPASAAQVIDQLTSIADLAPEEDDAQSAESYLQSSRMVGREREREWFSARLRRAFERSGTEVVIEGPSGIGKTRLLRELSVMAQLDAVIALHADAQAAQSAYGVAIALGLQLLDICPEIARHAAEPHAAHLGHVSPLLRDKLGVAALPPLAHDPNERRARHQTALHEWFMAVGRQLPLFLAVDNLQAADEDSAAFLAALGRESRDSRMLLAVTHRPSETVVAAAPVRMLRNRSVRLKLAGLSIAGCEEFVQSLFGDVANTGRTAKLLHERSAGNPGQCVELARLLVRKRIARYTGGTWHLPHEVSPEELPLHMEEVLAARRSALSAEARAVAEALCIHAKPVSLARCLTLVEGATQQYVYAALDELVAEQIVAVDQGYYRFEQTALREAMLSHLDQTRRRALHRQAAKSLFASGDTPEVRVEAALHLFRAGEDGQGADLLAHTGRDYFRQQLGQETLEQLIRALETAVDVYEREGRSEYDIAPLMFVVVSAAVFVDRDVTLKFGERALQLGVKITGLALAPKLKRFLGEKLGLYAALTVAAVRFANRRRRGLDYKLGDAIADLCTTLAAASSTLSMCADPVTLKRVVELLEPLRQFGEGHVATLMHDFARAQLCVVQGRNVEARDRLLQLRRQFGSPKLIELLGRTNWLALDGGIVFVLGFLLSHESGTGALQCARELETLGLRLWTMGADQLRMMHHALRGEVALAQRYREIVELHATQGGTTWQVEVFMPAVLFNAEALAKDVLSLRRTAEQVARTAKQVPGLQAYADAAQATYLSLRGASEEALVLFERALAAMPPRQRAVWAPIHTYAAQAMRVAGQPQRAKEVLLGVLAHATPEDFATVMAFLEPQRQLALVEAQLGNHAEAQRMLDALIGRHAADDQPLLVGLLHLARAEVALLTQDGTTFDAHAGQAERHFRATKNPALIAQWEQLLQQAVRSGLKARNEVAVARVARGDSTMLTTQQRVASELWSARDPYDHALRTIVQESRASGGYFYLYRDRGMHLAAATLTEDPPGELEQELMERAHRIELEASSAETDDAETQFVVSEPPENPIGSFQTIVLRVPTAGPSVVLGGVALRAGDAGALRIDVALLESVAQVLYERRGSLLE